MRLLIELSNLTRIDALAALQLIRQLADIANKEVTIEAKGTDWQRKPVLRYLPIAFDECDIWHDTADSDSIMLYEPLSIRARF